jgi:two-component system, NtrC family, nitrogen regulation response regulator NtrX
MMPAKRILVVDDESNIGRSLQMILEGEGYNVLVCQTAAEFRARAGKYRPDVCLVDVRLPDGNGIDLLQLLQVPAIMISGHGTIADAVQALRAGAFDFLEKPLARDKVLVVVKNAIETATLKRENERFRELVGEAPMMIGSSPAFKEAVEQATLVARSDARVLLTGESGTGKELLAAHIHRESPFSSEPFVKVNCAAIPSELLESELFGHEKGAFTGAVSARRGKFELADGGTIFLDEVGDLHEGSQAKRTNPACFGAGDRRDQSQSPGTRRPEQISRGLVLPLERRSGTRSIAAGTTGRHSRPRRLFLKRILRSEQFQAEDVRR